MDNCEALIENRASWRKIIRERCGKFERKRVEHNALQRLIRMRDDSAVPIDVLRELRCSVCGRFLLSQCCQKQALGRGRSNKAVYEEALPGRLTKHTCPTSGLVCKSAGGLTGHSKIQKDVLQPVTSNNGMFK